MAAFIRHQQLYTYRVWETSAFCHRQNEFQLWKVIPFLGTQSKKSYVSVSEIHLFGKPFSKPTVAVMLQTISNCYTEFQKILPFFSSSVQQVVFSHRNRNHHSRRI